MGNQSKLLRYYKGRPVKRIRKVKRGVLITFLSTKKGKAGTQITVSHEQWVKHHTTRFLPYSEYKAMRE